jgi:hypothetical protein
MGQQSKFFFSIGWYWKFDDCLQTSKINQIYTKKQISKSSQFSPQKGQNLSRYSLHNIHKCSTFLCNCTIFANAHPSKFHPFHKLWIMLDGHICD